MRAPTKADMNCDLERNTGIVDQVLQAELALHAHDGEADDAVTRRRDLFHLHLAFGADEEDFRCGIQFLQLVGDGDGREDVSSRPSAADDGSDGFVFHYCVVFCVHSV